MRRGAAGPGSAGNEGAGLDFRDQPIALVADADAAALDEDVQRRGQRPPHAPRPHREGEAAEERGDFFGWGGGTGLTTSSAPGAAICTPWAWREKTSKHTLADRTTAAPPPLVGGGRGEGWRDPRNRSPAPPLTSIRSDANARRGAGFDGREFATGDAGFDPGALFGGEENGDGTTLHRTAVRAEANSRLRSWCVCPSASEHHKICALPATRTSRLHGFTFTRTLATAECRGLGTTAC